MLSQVVTGACLEAQIMQQPVAIASLKPEGWLVHIIHKFKTVWGINISLDSYTFSNTYMYNFAYGSLFFFFFLSCCKLANCYVVDTK